MVKEDDVFVDIQLKTEAERYEHLLNQKQNKEWKLLSFDALTVV